MSSLPLGAEPDPHSKRAYHVKHRYLYPLYHTGAFPDGSGSVLRLKRPVQQPDICDRKQLKNPNGLILGTPGSGKSFAAKREMTNAFLITDDDIIICDPEAEYFSLVERLARASDTLIPYRKGIDGKPQYVNPMDINLNYCEDDSPLVAEIRLYPLPLRACRRRQGGLAAGREDRH